MKTETLPIPPQIRCEYIGNLKRPCLWRVIEPVSIELSDGTMLTIPAGYDTNFASVPKVLWGFFPPMGISICIASLVHDYLYDHRQLPINWDEKKRADKEFLYLLQKYNPDGEMVNKMMFVAVKLFGRKQFREE